MQLSQAYQTFSSSSTSKIGAHRSSNKEKQVFLAKYNNNLSQDELLIYYNKGLMPVKIDLLLQKKVHRAQA